MEHDNDKDSNHTITDPESQTIPSPTEELKGVAWVSGSKIFVQNPGDSCFAKAALTPCPEIKISVNGIPISGTIEITQEDKIEITPISHTVPGLIKALISPDKMSAFIDVKTECINTYELEESKPSPKLVLQARHVKQRNFPGSTQEILELLKQNHINFGVDTSAIVGLVNNPKDGMVLVAKGIPPGQSSDDFIELSFEQDYKNHLNNNTTEIVDFKELSSIPSVSAGETIARKIEGHEGKPGTTVTNQIVRAKEPKRLNLLSASGVEITEDGLKAISTLEGLPKVQKSGNNWIISVDSILTLPGNVNMKTGNIRFKGDVHILGSVDNDMSVSASGNINIDNIITKCKITAGGDVTIKGNIVNSEIVSGGFHIICNALKPILQDILKTLEDLYISACLMAEKLPSNSKVIFGNILVLLIEKRFSHLPSMLDKTQKKLKEMDIKLLGDYGRTLQRVINSLTGINLLQYTTANEFQNTIKDFTIFYYYIDSLVNKRSSVNIRVALNSVIRSSGDVIVSGSGCFNTHIIAEGNVKVEGVVRGGIIQAQDDVSIKELGSEMGVKSTVIVAKDKKISIDKAFEGVTVQVGKMSRVLEKQVNNIEASLDEEGYLQIRDVF